MRAIAVIPARFGSTRFPGKPLADRTGKPLIQHVYERVIQASHVDRVIVATDDARIVDAVKSFGGDARMTRADHLNGTARIAEVAAALDAQTIVNVQGDEPDIEPEHIDRAIEALASHDDCVIATLASPFARGEDASDVNIVKVVTDAQDRALYFSRALIPHERGGANAHGPVPKAPLLKHVGLYVYRRDFLLRYAALAPTPLEMAEQLEQLRVLEHGERIAVAVVEAQYHGIDTPEQYEAFVSRVLARRGE
jgi:3-deoxy-manno-octulosonate cytidylyltransferase (CMP-KDO synthetase)